MARTFISPRLLGLNALRKRFKKLEKAPTETMRKQLVRSWEGGADAFIRAAIRRVLVDTGMSAATFLPLSKAINRVQSTGIIEARIVSKRKHGSRPGIPVFPDGHRRAGRQGQSAGESLGKKAFVFQTPKPGGRFFVFRFSFQTVAFQHAIHEDMQQSLEVGIDAFLERIRKDFIKQAKLITRAYLRGRTIPSQGIL